MRIWAIVPAAGIGHRYGSAIPKQYLPLCGTPVLLHSIRRLLEIKEVEQILVPLGSDDTLWKNLEFSHPKVKTIAGGCDRSQSVINALEGLSNLAKEEDWVLVHDAVRPCVTEFDIKKIIREVCNDDVGGLLAYQVVDTIKELNGSDGVIKTIDREKLWCALTPQMFRYELIKKALRATVLSDQPVTDEASAIEFLGLSPKIIPGEKSNIKITSAEDMLLAELIIMSWSRK